MYLFYNMWSLVFHRDSQVNLPNNTPLATIFGYRNCFSFQTNQWWMWLSSYWCNKYKHTQINKKKSLLNWSIEELWRYIAKRCNVLVDSREVQFLIFYPFLFNRKKEEQYIERVGELDKVTEIRNQQRDLCEEMKKQRLQEFMAVSVVCKFKFQN